MRYVEEYELISEKVSLVSFDEKYPIHLFKSGIEDYDNFLKEDARKYIELGISSVHLLIENGTDFILGYIALLTDSFLLKPEEKVAAEIDILFNSVPALKVGKLATHIDRKEHHYGCYLLWYALGFAQELLESGVACRFLTVDADIEYNPETPDFYIKNGFVFNEHNQYKRKEPRNLSMRYDVFS